MASDPRLGPSAPAPSPCVCGDILAGPGSSARLQMAPQRGQRPVPGAQLMPGQARGPHMAVGTQGTGPPLPGHLPRTRPWARNRAHDITPSATRDSHGDPSTGKSPDESRAQAGRPSPRHAAPTGVRRTGEAGDAEPSACDPHVQISARRAWQASQSCRRAPPAQGWGTGWTCVLGRWDALRKRQGLVALATGDQGQRGAEAASCRASGGQQATRQAWFWGGTPQR